MSSDPITVGVVMGGTSTEHDVSMKSGTGMLGKLDRDKYTGFPIVISPENRWIWPKGRCGEYHLEELINCQNDPGGDWEQVDFPCFRTFPRCDIMLIGLHGTGGEDGRLQGFLDLCGQAYTGSGCMGSAVAMDKIKSKELFTKSGILTPRYRVLAGEFGSDDTIKDLENQLGLPLVLKVPQGGSSLGVTIADSREELQLQLEHSREESGILLVEECIRGREATCGYIENFEPLPPTEIIPLKDGFFNYEAKYDMQRTREVTPAEFEPVWIEKMQALAAQCHKVLGLSVYSRTDFMVKDNQLYVLETNSLPGFTDASILPQEAQAAGLNYTDLLTKIIEESLRK
ncbi:D-alanine--D-alanine ligase [Fibrobacterota bacterium]